MFTVKIGPQITEVECPLLEQMAATVDAIEQAVAELDAKVQLLLDEVQGVPRIEFTIGPISEQE